MLSQHSGIDFAAYDREGKVVLLVEAKSRSGTSEHWAARLRRNMLAHGVLPRAKYFLIATPEKMYLWKQERFNPSETPPEFTIDAATVLEPYFQRLHQAPSKISPEAFELLVLTWLTDIARHGGKTSEQDTSSSWLPELTGSLQQARIEMHPVQ
jgi:hypothetical protein